MTELSANFTTEFWKNGNNPEEMVRGEFGGGSEVVDESAASVVEVTLLFFVRG